LSVPFSRSVDVDETTELCDSDAAASATLHSHFSTSLSRPRDDNRRNAQFAGTRRCRLLFLSPFVESQRTQLAIGVSVRGTREAPGRDLDAVRSLRVKLTPSTQQSAALLVKFSRQPSDCRSDLSRRFGLQLALADSSRCARASEVTQCEIREY